jgi:CBS-domain-containing membrane protein
LLFSFVEADIAPNKRHFKALPVLKQFKAVTTVNHREIIRKASLRCRERLKECLPHGVGL